MDTRTGNPPAVFLSKKAAFAFLALAALAFHVSFADRALAPFVLIYLGCAIELTRAPSSRTAFYAGLVLGLLVFAPKLTFFYTIFGLAAVPLWFVLALWQALFVYLGRFARAQFQPKIALVLIPIFWTGLEYFRSELYPLKFSWLSPAFAFGPSPLLHIFGAYGLTFVLLILVAAISTLRWKPRLIASASLFAAAFIPFVGGPAEGRELRVAGMQLEFPVELEVPAHLDALKHKYPDTPLYVLSEYTFDGPIPPRVRAWCKLNGEYLIAGGKDPAPNGNYYNTAFVVGPDGEILFKQVKAVPIQFFKDGLPAPSQHVWDSPWGKIGLCICYDLSYTRVVDELVRQGAEIIINPTMDVADWGGEQHKLHSWIAPMRAAEYRIPIFRVASSGISQAILPTGKIVADAPFPGEEHMIAAALPLSRDARLPLDRFLAPLCSAISGLAVLWTFLPAKIRG
jgi:apolipoprotein N-acyltransferase